jgi:peptide/nickel transport system permease protein
MPFARYVARRLLWMVPSLLGITLVTLLLMDLAPSSRAEIEIGNPEALTAHTDAEARAAKIRLLREHWGLIDPETGAPYSVWRRWLQWLGRACTLDLAGPGTDEARFYGRIERALPVTLLLNVLALLVALGVAIPLGARLGMARAGPWDRALSAGMFALYCLPEFLLATLLLVVFGGGIGEPLLPVRGLRSDGSGELPVLAQVWDMAQHLALPVLALAAGPCVVVTRFLRDSVGRAVRSDFVLALRGWGLPESVVRRRALHNGLSPLVTLLGVLLPALVSGSVVVENVFTLPGLGQLAFESARRQELPMVMAMTLLVSVVTLLSLLLSDVLQRVVDPRVELR